MDEFDTALERELTLDITADAMTGEAKQGNPIAAKIAEHRDALNRAAREIMAIERERDLQVREAESGLEQAEFVYTNAVAHFNREISKTRAQAGNRISVQRQLLRSAEAALVALEPYQAPKDEEAGKRRVPRAVPGE